MSSSFSFGVLVADGAADRHRSDRSFSFVVNDRTVSVDPFKGPVLLEHFKRVDDLGYIQNVLQRASVLKQPNVVVVGAWYPMVQASVHDEKQGLVHYLSIPDSNECRRYLDKGVAIYFLADQENYIRMINGYDLNKFGERLLD